MPTPALAALAIGLFVPKPSTNANYQRCGMPDLGSTVRQRPLLAMAVTGDCYSLGYSVARRVAGIASSATASGGPRIHAGPR